jgi:hypothetical protein
MKFRPKILAEILISKNFITSISGHWLLMDAMGMGLCVAFIAFVRLPSLKVDLLYIFHESP